MEDITFSDKQQEVIDRFLNKENIIVIGVAGSGKSMLIKEIKRISKANNIAITATTGIAAYHIGGVTLHSFLGIGTGELDINKLLWKIKRKDYLISRIRELDILVIDEISMMSGELFEKIERICREVRNNNQFFGGIQVILTGDFFQLLPINVNKNQTGNLLFESEIFKQHLEKNTIKLDRSFRQDDNELIDILSRLRIGVNNKSDINKLKSRMIDPVDVVDAVYLVPTNKQMKDINETELSKLQETALTYTATYKGHQSIIDDLKTQFEQKGINELKLKRGSKVMLLRNIDVTAGLVNGSVGVILEFLDKFPLVRFGNGKELLIKHTEFQVDIGKNSAKATQIPLMLAWALNIHKSQSLTLNNAVMDLENCFCDHQVYVALSRIKNLKGLYLKSFNNNRVLVNKKVKDYLQ